MGSLLWDRAELHAIDEAVLREDVGRDDEFIAGLDSLNSLQVRNGVFNRSIGLAGERHEERLDGSEQTQLTKQFLVWGEGENGRTSGALCGEPVGHESATSKCEYFRMRDLVGQDDGGMKNFHAIARKDSDLTLHGVFLKFYSSGDF